jgi:hypothetical protein
MTERAEKLVRRAEAADTIEAFRAVYQDASAANDVEPFADADKAVLAAAFNLAVVRLVAF